MDGASYASVEEALKAAAGAPIRLRGWLHRTRSSGGIVFSVLRDGTAIIQVTVKKGAVPDAEFESAQKALIESSVEVEGTVHNDARAPGGKEVRASAFRVVAFAENFPITGKETDETLLDIRHLWLRSREMASTMKVRATILDLLREFYDGQGYTEVHCPTFVSGQTEGGSTLFRVPYFDDEVFLTQSSQLYLETMIFSLGKVYTLQPSFRAEKSRTRRHLTEYWHFEVEAAWYSNDEMMAEEEKMLAFLARQVVEKHPQELAALKRDPGKLKNIEPPFPRIRYEEAIELANKRGLHLKYGDDFGYEEEKVLTEGFEKPFFITHFPKEVKAFYHRPDPAGPKTVLNHDLLAPEGYGEVIGGGERIWELQVLLDRIKEANLEEEDYKWYVDLRRYGSVPHAGYGLGVDRLVMYFLGLEHIKWSLPYPRMMRRVYP
ncbi:MAG TPA: asparagine--tRNA ligase [Candidatus Thermoplasmatota archaeon]|nr:asparagine--tRNA ligase [Candidatus Thermoplasmatota archaeon]